jgi:hypothetical protein
MTMISSSAFLFLLSGSALAEIMYLSYIDLSSKAIPDLEVGTNRRVCKVALFCSTRPDLQIRIHHCLSCAQINRPLEKSYFSPMLESN